MKIRRHIIPGRPGTSVIEVETAGGWTALAEDEAAQLAWLTGLPPPASKGGLVLPFQPRSFRDVLLYEDHWVNSSRGYVRRFMPAASRLAQAYEKLTGSTFPAFRPPKLSNVQPVYYFGNHLTIVPSGTPIAIPTFTQALDYELELGFVLARPLRNATPEEAHAAIGGFVVVNDFSARDIQRAEMRSGFGPQKSKHFMSSMSGTLVTADEILPRLDALRAVVEINGRHVARPSAAGMRWSLSEVLAHLSKDEQLHPGELIATGTLPGGCGLEAGHLLAKGDELRLVIEGVGEITHRIL
ncbi:fumarylacetoacetate hydrolase family protein [Taklimakanibacter lacteus]|uniref:fumarylacetoacetate hydrolase family protein n=1 Tax=Taklimakanibacter lacteus TaxID=2268456 RepID=UPI0034D66E4D